MRFASSFAFVSSTLAGATLLASIEPTFTGKSVAPDGMVWIPGGMFLMGTTDPTGELCGGPDPMPDARPIHAVRVDGFWMDTTEVTNKEFARFVRATGYVTVAERTPNAEDFPGVPGEFLVPGSVVFTPPAHAVQLGNPLRWWSYVPGAN